MSLRALILFAATAAADVTTSIWIPSRLDSHDVGYLGSVVDVQNDKTTLALVYDDDTDTDLYYSNTPKTITVAGNTYYEAATTTSVRSRGDYTYSLGCSLPTSSRAKPTCTSSIGGAYAFKYYCSDYSSYTNVVTRTYEYTYTSNRYTTGGVETDLYTIDYRTEIPDYCTAGSTLPASVATDTFTLSAGYAETYQVVITAGTEKLSGVATTGASATGSGAQSTGSGSSNGTVTTGGASATNTGTAGAPQGTGAAAPMITKAPMLIGAAAAVAACLL